LLNIKQIRVILMLDKVIEIGLLIDFYGELLTEKQQKALKLYYYQDFNRNFSIPGRCGDDLG